MIDSISLGPKAALRGCSWSALAIFILRITLAVQAVPRLKTVPCPLPRRFGFCLRSSAGCFFPQRLQNGLPSGISPLHFTQTTILTSFLSASAWGVFS